MTAVRVAQRGHMIGTLRPIVKGAVIGVAKRKRQKGFAKRLAELLDARDWPQRGRPARLAALAPGVSRRSVDAYLRGDRAPSVPHLQLLAAALGVPVVALLASGTEVPAGEAAAPQGRRSGREAGKGSGKGRIAQNARNAQYECRGHALDVDLLRDLVGLSVDLLVTFASQPAASLLSVLDAREATLRETYGPDAPQALKRLRTALEERAAREDQIGHHAGA